MDYLYEDTRMTYIEFRGNLQYMAEAEAVKNLIHRKAIETVS